MDNTNDEVIVSGMFLIILGFSYYVANSTKNHRRKRRWGVRPINQKRIIKGHFYNLFYDLKTVDEEHFVKYTRMTSQCFYILFDYFRNTVKMKQLGYIDRFPILFAVHDWLMKTVTD